MRQWLEPLNSGWAGVATHKLRSFLAILGIVIGVAAVIALMSIGKGTEEIIVSNVRSLGSNLVFVQPGSTTAQGMRSGLGGANTLTLEDAREIEAQVPNIQSVAPYQSLGQRVVVKGQNTFARILGITPQYQEAFNLVAAEGELISEQQYQTALPIALLGSRVKEWLFPEDDAIDETIRIGRITVRVAGVLQSKGESVVGPADYSVLIPLTTLQRAFAQPKTNRGERIINNIVIALADQSDSRQVIDEITRLLRYRHQLADSMEDDFTITSQEDIIKTLTQAMASMTLLLGAIAAISLLVGGIGVMNIMLVSVIERTREIGIRKALGAGEWNIRFQFLIEAAFLTLTGGLIGVTVGWGASYLISNMAQMATIVTPDIVVLAVSVSVGIGMFFGFYPAWRASRLDPIEALHSE